MDDFFKAFATGRPPSLDRPPPSPSAEGTSRPVPLSSELSSYLDGLFPSTERGPDEVPKERPFTEELVLDARGRPRQAGSTVALDAQSPWIVERRQLAEGSLFFFLTGILDRTFLTADCHAPVAAWLQTCPPHRKLLLMPREHGKTVMVAQGLPLHILIQPAEKNIYFAGQPGTDQRIILMCETERLAKDRIRVIAAEAASNPRLKAFWPDVFWDEPRRQSPKWTDDELIFPRAREWTDPSIRGVGVGGAITGAHPSALIKDDLIAFEAMNSEATMLKTIDYHRTSRALIGSPGCLEWIIGTRWAVADLYAEIIEKDPTVETWIMAMVYNGKALWPERFPLDRIPSLQAEHGIMFPLFYMNSAADPLLTDFDVSLLRKYTLQGDKITFAEEGRDLVLQRRDELPPPAADVDTSGKPMTDLYDLMGERLSMLREVRS